MKEEVEQAKIRGGVRLHLANVSPDRDRRAYCIIDPDVPFRKVIIFYIVEDYMERNRS